MHTCIVVHAGQNYFQSMMQAPTFLDLAGAAIPDDMDGVSLKSVLMGEAEQDEVSLSFAYPHHVVANCRTVLLFCLKYPAVLQILLSVLQNLCLAF